MSTDHPLDRLLTVGAPSLEQPAPAVIWPDTMLAFEVTTLHEALDAFRAEHGFGRAIAAPQLGINKRFIAMHLNGNRITLVNPRITWRSRGTFEVWDDCMSVPGVEVKVRRNLSVSVEFENTQGKADAWNSVAADLSELLQHEIDHLDGILMLSRAVDSDATREKASGEGAP